MSPKYLLHSRTCLSKETIPFYHKILSTINIGRHMTQDNHILNMTEPKHLVVLNRLMGLFCVLYIIWLSIVKIWHRMQGFSIKQQSNMLGTNITNNSLPNGSQCWNIIDYFAFSAIRCFLILFHSLFSEVHVARSSVVFVRLYQK